MTILRVRKQSFNGYIRYKYTDKYDWTNKDIDSVEDPIEFVYGPSMTTEDIAKVKSRWQHKLNITKDCHENFTITRRDERSIRTNNY